MLESVEAEIGLAGRIGMAVDGDDAAFFAELGVFDRDQGTGIREQRRGGWRRRARKRRSFDSLRSLRMTFI
jgi:hypothetical protein